MGKQPQNKSKKKVSTQKQPKRSPTSEQTRLQSPLPALNPVNLAEFTPAELVQLQRTVGNRSVSRMLEQTVQREDDDLLSANQTVKAMSYYERRSDQYTEAIISQLQAALGLPETGRVDEALVQAAAGWQAAHPPLAVDGMIGPRTLPALIPGGLAEQEEIETFAGDAKGVIEGDDWATQSKEERVDAILAEVNKRLTAANVPEVGKVIQDLGGDAGRFSFSLWSIRFDEGIFSQETLTDAEKADLADTVYHEARHAEQWYRMAQMLAGEGKTAAEIRSEMSIPADQAGEAFDHPLAEGSMDALIADGWYQSVYGTGREERGRVLGDEGTFEEYQNLPEESDAWRVGGAVTEAYNKEEEEGGG
jgi:hypothetical protein